MQNNLLIKIAYNNMNTRLLIIVVLVTGLTSSCYRNDDQPIPAPSENTACFTVLDDFTNQPLDSVSVCLRIDTKYSFYNLLGLTDSFGNCCLNYGLSESIYEFSIWKSGFDLFYMGNIGYDEDHLTVKLKPVSSLCMHVKNILPASAYDRICIECPAVNYSGIQSQSFEGAAIDTTVTFITPPGDRYIFLILWHDTLRTDSVINVTLHSHDTTFVNILY
jgi:hypothetical protein